ncbi:MAG TPA: TetR/AcrR family transcriptional regulator [Thermodesulfobacteriota bacterium]|nr:TetR/AcrR family transcriptional regulator [Thermodesulfobacteriota bacterium]
MARSKTNESAKKRIINKALELFYRQGYSATGINQVIAESGVSKNTFYYYFPSKDDLCVAYLQEMDTLWRKLVKDEISSGKKPLQRLLAPLEFLKKWNQDNKFRGCPFLNIVSEVTDSASNIRREVIYHKDGFKTIIRELVKDFKNSDAKYSDIDVSFVTEAYFLIAEGAIVTSQNYQSTNPFLVARKNIEKLLNP